MIYNKSIIERITEKKIREDSGCEQIESPKATPDREKYQDTVKALDLSEILGNLIRSETNAIREYEYAILDLSEREMPEEIVKFLEVLRDDERDHLYTLNTMAKELTEKYFPDAKLESLGEEQSTAEIPVTITIAEAKTKLNQKKLEKEILAGVKTAANQGLLDEEYTVVEVTEKGVEVRTEAGYDALFEIAELLNPVVQKYDEAAYFDMADSGILEATFTG